MFIWQRVHVRVPVPPDELPRSPTGRVPRWVIDEAAGRANATTPWRPSLPTVEPSAPPPPLPRRRPLLGAGSAVVGIVTLGLWVAGGSPGLPQVHDALATQAPVAEPSVPPTAEIVALADEAHLSDAGRALFYSASPEVLEAAAFAGRCEVAQPARQPTGSTVGCYWSQTNSIIIYAPADPRLRGSVVETAAHQTLHAAWDQLTAEEQAALTPPLEAEIAAVPADDVIHEQVASSVGIHPESRPTELFAYLGTQVWREGGLDPALEAAWATVVADRAALVGVHTGWVGMLDQLAVDLSAADQALVDQEDVTAQERAQYEADAAGAEAFRRHYESTLAEISALSADERSRTRLWTTWWDGTELPMAPADETLARMVALIDRDVAGLATRAAALQAAEDAAATERTRLDGLRADVDAVRSQLDPTSAG